MFFRRSPAKRKKTSTKKEAVSLNLKSMLWDYPHHLKDDLWRARRMAEFFPFVLEELTDSISSLWLKMP